VFVRHGEARSADTVVIVVDGREIRVPAGVSVAAALLGAGHVGFTAAPVSGRARGPWCLMGACFACLVAIDGIPGERACMTTVRDGMRIALGSRGEGSALERDPWGPPWTPPP
jgi:predicted molibdopterin-dependent oxidoreductase YjgC